MNKSKISQALTQGLLAGYGGKSNFLKTTRGSFEVSSSHFEINDIVYHDEWTNGGGQEIVKVGNDLFTRVYAGGVFGESKEVIQKLIYFIQKLTGAKFLFCPFLLIIYSAYRIRNDYLFRIIPFMKFFYKFMFD